MVVAKTRPVFWDEDFAERPSDKGASAGKSSGKRNGGRNAARGTATRQIGVSVSKVALTAVSAVFVAFTLLSFVALRMQAVRIGYDVDSARRELMALRSENERLNLTLERLRSLDRVEQVARDRLGFVRPESVKYVDAAQIETPAPTAPIREVAEGAGRGVWPAISRRVGGWISCVTVALASQFVARWFCSIP